MSSPIDRKKYKRAVIILAGGEGIHLHESTKHVPQHHIPEQFCICTDQDTLLAQTLRAAAWLAPLKATAIVVNRAHREFYNQLTGMPRSSIVAQPSNRGTLLAILWGLRHLQNLERETIVAVLPCDHRFGNYDRLVHHVQEATAGVEASPSLSVVLGMVPTTTESSFGWIEPGERIYPLGLQLFRARGFREPAQADVAAKLKLEGCLWNSLVMIATAPRLLEMIGECAPEPYVAFNAAFASLDYGGQYGAIEELYLGMRTCRFSQDVLARCPPGLAVKWVDDIEHNNIDRVAPPRTLSRGHWQPKSSGEIV